MVMEIWTYRLKPRAHEEASRHRGKALCSPAAPLRHHLVRYGPSEAAEDGVPTTCSSEPSRLWPREANKRPGSTVPPNRATVHDDVLERIDSYHTTVIAVPAETDATLATSG